MRKKLARWKSQYISKGGRITLIRSTLANMPIYFMSMLSMPRKVRLRLEWIQREFLWGGGALERKIHLVKWELGKIWGGARGLEFKGSKGETHGVGLWKTLRKEWEVVKSRLVFVVGNGKRIKFWKDIWCGDEPLCVSFPSLFALAVSKDAWVKDVWRCNEGGGSWSPLFSRPFNDWELEEVCSFFVALNRKQIQQGVDDRVIWRETNCGKFSVKSLYKSLVSGHPISFPLSAIWKVTVQPRVSFLGGKQCGERLSPWISFKGEVRTLWVLLYSMFGVQWVLPATVKETLSGWNGSFVGKKRKGVWKASPLCLFWTVWKTRNKVAFEEEELSIQRLKASFVYFLWLETKRSIKDGPSTLVDFVGWVASLDKVQALKRYKFSLAFENSNEEDYVTEKFFQSLVAAESPEIKGNIMKGVKNHWFGKILGSVPVVVGAPNIQDFAPSLGSILHIKELKDAEPVAKTMKYLAEHPEAYNQSLRWKYEGPSDSFKALVDMAAVHSSCRLCIHLATAIREREENSPGFQKRPCKCTRGSETVYHLYIRERGRFEMESIFLSNAMVWLQYPTKSTLLETNGTASPIKGSGLELTGLAAALALP
ncbi:Glycoprotein 3-alpha-L-fucosyltransferase A [Vitis vinifera]|uniref:Fucosyltransferase n=1 Tax=Vitis vinifera TaxID=29760 RepID=A0A438EQ34_VITVI|nr:Glycoprotein 3-alpha-L-fucosyltransferase A [Vitis vinifera]